MCACVCLLRFLFDISFVWLYLFSSFVVGLFVNFQSQLKQCQELLANIDESGEVYLHCLGNAIKRGINLALTLVQQSDGGFGYEANTSTINLIGMFLFGFLLFSFIQLIILCFSIADDLHPLNDEEDFSIQRRKNSCLHIKVFRHSNVLKTRKNWKKKKKFEEKFLAHS